MQMHHIHIERHAFDIPITIGTNLWENLRAFLSEKFSTHSIFVISDLHVTQHYKQSVKEILGVLPQFGGHISFPPGEKSKTRLQKALLEDELLQRKAGRDSVIVAMGGGVTGDLAGFVASTLFRGVPLVHFPTTLMAQVDSSIGGKVGVNSNHGKNLIGAFYQPEAIFIDISFLESLPSIEFANGMAEVIKYAITLDNELLNWLENDSEKILNRDPEILIKIITRCVQLKSRVVQSDERESGYRSILNFGHTIGHAIEKIDNYKTKHGFAVSAGMEAACKLSHKLFDFPNGNQLHNLLQIYGLNKIGIKDYEFEQIWECILHDKKTRKKNPHFTLLNQSAKPELFVPVSKEELKNVLFQS